MTLPPTYEQWPPKLDISAESRVDTQLHNAMDLDSVTERDSRAPSTFSMDDLEVAKALTGLREGLWPSLNISASWGN